MKCNSSFYYYFPIFLPEHMYFLYNKNKGEHSYHVYHFIKSLFRDKVVINSVPFSKVRGSCGVTGPENIEQVIYSVSRNLKFKMEMSSV